MNTKRPERQQRPEPVYLFVERPRCPKCGNVRLLAQRSETSSDGSTCRHCKCADCGERIRVVLE